MKRYKILFTFVLITVIIFSFSFIACGTKKTEPPVKNDPIVVTDDCRETKTFTFDPRYSGEYIFFGNTRYYDITVKEYAEELVPTANGEYLLSGGGKYSVSFDGCEEDEYTLTYDVSDDREFALAPGEEYLVKLGRIWNEVRTLETGNENILISGVYKGSADDLESADLYGRITDPVSNYTMAWQYDDGDYYATVVNTGDGEETASLSFADIPHVTVGADGSAETTVNFDGEHYSYICFEDLPAGNYVMTVSNVDSLQSVIYDKNFNTLGSFSSSNGGYFTTDTASIVYIGFMSHNNGSHSVNIQFTEDQYQWVVNTIPTYGPIYVAQGESISFDFLINNEQVNFIADDFNDNKNYSYIIDNEYSVVKVDASSYVDGRGFCIYAFVDGMASFAAAPMLTIIPTLAEPFSGLSGIVADEGKVTMQWQTVPNLYSFEYKLNGVLQPELLVGEKTSSDITSALPKNADRAIVEITEITYSYPVYGEDGNPTGETKKVTHPASEDMVYIANLK